MRWFETTLVLVVASLIFFSANVYASSAIVFDNSCGFFGLKEESSLGLSILREELEFRGYTVNDNLGMGAQIDAITQELLEKADILVIINPNRTFKKKEKDLIKRFIRSGKKLLLVCDYPHSARCMNELSREFEVEFLGNYYLGNCLTLNLDFGQVSLFSPVPLDLHEKPDIFLHAEKIEAKWWPSRWEIPREPLREGDFTFFAGIEHGKGRVAFLGDKDIFLNENIRKGNNLSFVLNIFDWLTFIKRNDEVTYAPEVLDFTGKDTASLLIENKGEGDQTLNFVVPSHLNMDISRRSIHLLPGAKELVIIKLNQADYPFSDFIVVERQYGFHSCKDHIPVRAMK